MYVDLLVSIQVYLRDYVFKNLVSGVYTAAQNLFDLGGRYRAVAICVEGVKGDL